jgi:hypothetical protein
MTNGLDRSVCIHMDVESSEPGLYYQGNWGSNVWSNRHTNLYQSLMMNTRESKISDFYDFLPEKSKLRG